MNKDLEKRIKDVIFASRYKEDGKVFHDENRLREGFKAILDAELNYTPRVIKTIEELKFDRVESQIAVIWNRALESAVYRLTRRKNHV